MTTKNPGTKQIQLNQLPTQKRVRRGTGKTKFQGGTGTHTLSSFVRTTWEPIFYQVGAEIGVRVDADSLLLPDGNYIGLDKTKHRILYAEHIPGNEDSLCVLGPKENHLHVRHGHLYSVPVKSHGVVRYTEKKPRFRVALAEPTLSQLLHPVQVQALEDYRIHGCGFPVHPDFQSEIQLGIGLRPFGTPIQPRNIRLGKERFRILPAHWSDAGKEHFVQQFITTAFLPLLRVSYPYSSEEMQTEMKSLASQSRTKESRIYWYRVHISLRMSDPVSAQQQLENVCVKLLSLLQSADPDEAERMAYGFDVLMGMLDRQIEEQGT